MSSSWKGKIKNGENDNCLCPVASIRAKENYSICSGIVISQFHVISVAFCTYPYEPDLHYYGIFVSVAFISHTIRLMESHPSYKHLSNEFDISVITVSRMAKIVSNGIKLPRWK